MNNQTKTGYKFCDFILLYILVLFFAFIKYNIAGIFSDHLGIQQLDAKQFFSILLTTTGSLLGILIAALLLSFQLISKEAKRRKEGNVLYNKWVIRFFSLCLFLILALTISYVIVPSFNSDSNLSLGYYLLYSFIIFLALLFYVVYILLRDTNTFEKVNQIINSLEITDFEAVKNSYHQNLWLNAHDLKMSLIKDEVLYAIRDNDNSALHVFLSNLIFRANKLIIKSIKREDCESIISGITILLRDAEAAASSNQRFTFYEIMSNSIELLYHHAGTEKIPLLYYNDVRQYYVELAENLARKSDIINLRKIIDVLLRSLIFHFQQNCPVENELEDLLELYNQKEGIYNINASLQWDKIGEFIYDINRLQQLAIDQKLREIYIAASRSLIRIISLLEHGDFPLLGKFQRAYIITKVINLYILSYADKALSVALFEDTLETYQLEGKLIADIIVNDPIAFQKVLKNIGDHLINAFRKSKLNDWWTLNKFGAIPRHTAKYYKTNENVRVATRYIFEVLKKIKGEIEVDQTSKNWKIYDELKRQLKGLLVSLTEHDLNVNEIELIPEIDQCISSFQQFNTILDSNIVPWPSYR